MDNLNNSPKKKYASILRLAFSAQPQSLCFLTPVIWVSWVTFRVPFLDSLHSGRLPGWPRLSQSSAL